jgi:drug/metabolite transporter (DMT)-like permease
VFALLLVPNSLLARVFLGHRVTGRFLAGSAVAMAGVGLLFVNEVRQSEATPEAVAAGIGLTLLGVLSASVSNVMQAGEKLRNRPIAAMIAWGMFYGTVANALFGFVVYGPPVFEARLGYWLGLIYLGLFASALAFTFYFRILRAVGPGRPHIPACSFQSSPWRCRPRSRIITGHGWRSRAGCWRWQGW